MINAVACVVERCRPIIISAGSIREVFEKASNYSLSNSEFAACSKEESIIVHMIIAMLRQSVTPNYFTDAFLRVSKIYNAQLILSTAI